MNARHPSEGELFKKILGPAWKTLHPDIQRRFDKNPLPGQPLYYTGTLTELTASRLGRWLGFMSRPFIQGALFAAMRAGTNVASDIESGFLNRLALTPLRRATLMLGQLTGILALGLIQALAFVAVGLSFGEGLAAGPGGVVVLVLLSLTITLAFGGIGAFHGIDEGAVNQAQLQVRPAVPHRKRRRLDEVGQGIERALGLPDPCRQFGALALGGASIKQPEQD